MWGELLQRLGWFYFLSNGSQSYEYTCVPSDHPIQEWCGQTRRHTETRTCWCITGIIGERQCTVRAHKSWQPQGLIGVQSRYWPGFILLRNGLRVLLKIWRRRWTLCVAVAANANPKLAVERVGCVRIYWRWTNIGEHKEDLLLCDHNNHKFIVWI